MPPPDDLRVRALGGAGSARDSEAPLFELEHLTVRFSGQLALDNLTAELRGRAVGLLGPNGAGKTTLMRALLGLLRPSGGRAWVLGEPVQGSGYRLRAHLGFAAEGPGRLPGLSGLESVSYAAELCGIPRRTALLRAHDMLDLVGLDEARYRPVEGYSTGMNQRVKVAMALVHDPQLVLLDEPTSGLDPQSRDDLLDLVRTLRESDGPAVLLSTHLLHDVERTCDSCLILAQGQLRYAGSLGDLKRPAAHEWTVRLLRPLPEFVRQLEARGLTVQPQARPDMYSVRGEKPQDVAMIGQVALQVGATVAHLEASALTLEEAFMAAIEAPR